VYRAVVLEGAGGGGGEGLGTVVAGRHRFTNEMRFANPGPLSVGENDGDGVAGSLEVGYEGVNVGRGLVRGWTVVVCYLGVVRFVGIGNRNETYQDMHRVRQKIV